MFESFEHYLSYGSTDQQTVRDLSGMYSGLLVPGTIAAFQAEGTKGFVLTLSASSGSPYVIDSRFPLFQNSLSDPKKSHLMLADLLGVPELLTLGRAPVPADFSAETVKLIAHRWVDFNNGFEDVQTKTFEKYAARLGEPVLPEDRQKPSYILPPYLMVDSIEDGWWPVSAAIWAESLVYATSLGLQDKLRRVIAVRHASNLGPLLSSVSEFQVVEWVSNLDEFKLASENELVAYGRSLQSASEQGKEMFALYGGFFSVLMSRYGLRGSSHGIGFGEHRDWVELPSSGAPPARYYVPRLHKYVGVDIAVAIWRQFPELIACPCDECEGGSPGALEYHDLMRHSVRVRHREIEEWQMLPTVQVRERLGQDFEAFREGLKLLDAPEQLRRRAEDIHLHLPMWSRALRGIED